MSGEARGVWHRVKREAEQQAGRLTRGNKAPRHSPESSCSHPLATTPVAAAAPSDDSSGSGEAGAYTRSVHTRHAVLACGERQPPPHQRASRVETVRLGPPWPVRGVPSARQGAVKTRALGFRQ